MAQGRTGTISSGVEIREHMEEVYTVCVKVTSTSVDRNLRSPDLG